jgi:hypothetical protein
MDFENLLQEVEACRARNAVEEELANRLAIFRHPQDTLRANAIRLQNIYDALSCIFYDWQTSRGKANLAKELLTAVSQMPDTASDVPLEQYNALHRYERFYRMLISEVDVDAVFGAPYEASPWVHLDFFTSNGMPVDVHGLQATIERRGVEVIFFAGASEDYAMRYNMRHTKTLIYSVLKECDSSCLLFVCIASGNDCIADIAKRIGVNDERLIYCKDDYSEQPEQYMTCSPSEDKLYENGSHRYPSMGFLNLGFFLETFKLPVFIFSLDTILRRGVQDLVTGFKGNDVVVNMIPKPSLGSQLVASLILIYPTENAMIFSRFFLNYLGKACLKSVQPKWLDQVVFLLGVHHLAVNGHDPQIGIFDEYDINNGMFTCHNLSAHRELFDKYRFINVFGTGVFGQEIDPKDIFTDQEFIASLSS